MHIYMCATCCMFIIYGYSVVIYMGETNSESEIHTFMAEID